MSLKEDLSVHMKTALKAQDKEKLAFARNLHAAIRKKEIDDRLDLDDAAVVKIVIGLVKQRHDSIEQFKQGGREDLVAKEQAELEFLKTFLPEQMNEEEVKKWIDWAIVELSVTSSKDLGKDLGKVMKLVLSKVQGYCDSKQVQQWAREKIIALSPIS